MPFSKTAARHTADYWANHFEKFLKPLIEEGGHFKAEKSAPIRTDLLRQIVTDLVTAPVVVADLTDYNPNVLWELGVRQSFRNGTITIARHGTKLPFDLTTKGTLFYHPKDHLRNEDFRRDFRRALQDCIERPEAVDSLVLETISGRGSVYQVIRSDETRRRLEAAISEAHHNLRHFKHIRDVIDKNTANNRQSVATIRLRLPCMELLVTNRYLDADPAFYASCEQDIINFHAINGQLELWRPDFSRTQSWLDKNLGGFEEHYTKTLERLEESLTRTLRQA